MVANMLDGIKVKLGASENDWRIAHKLSDLTIYTGIPDALVPRLDPLPYRSLKFDFDLVAAGEVDTLTQLNECNRNAKYTRYVNHSQFLHKDLVERAKDHVIHREYSIPYDGTNTPYYPEPHRVNDLQEYLHTVQNYASANHMMLLGRLATYKYMDMDVTVAAAIMRLQKFGMTV